MEHESEYLPLSRVNSYSVADEPIAKPPIIFSWGRSDTNTLLSSPGDKSIDGMNMLTFAPRRTILQISSNSYHVAAVTSTGELYTCGSNAEGQIQPFATQDGADEGRPRIVEEIGNHRVCAVACGLYHTVCLTASGLALSFGGNETGQLGHSGGKISRCGPKVVEFKTKSKGPLVIKQVACGDLFTAFLTTSGEVFCCGIGANVGNAGQENVTAVSQAECVESLVGTNIVWIATGSSHAIAVAASGEVYTWGDGRMGQLGLGDDILKLDEVRIQTPRKVVLPTNVGRVIGASAGLNHSLLWTDTGVLLGSGSNKYGQLGCMVPRLTSFEPLSGPTEGSKTFFCTMAACGTNHSIALWSSIAGYDPTAAAVAAVSREYPVMRVTGFGSNNFGQITGSSSASMFRSPEDITDLVHRQGGSRVLYISAGGDQSFLISTRSADEANEQLNGMALFQKQFSTQMSRAPTPLSASVLLRILTDAHEAIKSLNEADARHMRELSAALTTACELFSSPSLLSASFIDASQPLQLDVAGVEAVYVMLMQLGKTALTRLVAALQQSIAGLESVGGSLPSATKSTGPVRLPDGALRVLLVLWQCPCNATALLSADIYGRLMKIIANLPVDQRADLFKVIPKLYPTHLFASRLLKPLHEHLMLQVQNPTGLAPLFCEAFRWLHDLNRVEKLVPASVFYNTALSDLADSILLKDYIEWKTYFVTIAARQKQPNPPPLPEQHPFFIATYAFLLSAEAKKRILLAESAIQQQAAQHQAAVAGLTQGFYIPFFVLRIEREHLLRHTLQQIVTASDAELRKPLRVVFENEEGIDEGGVRKEFFQLLTTQLMSVQYGMFSPTADGRSLWINQACLWNAEEYRLIGVLLGLAVYNGVLLDVHFPKVMYKKLLRQDKFELDDLVHVDPVLHDGLKKLLEYTPAEEVEHVFCRTFEVEWEEFGARRSHELIPGGKDVAVTHLNRHDYVEKLVHWLLVGSIDVQFQELYAGFSRVVNPGSTITFSSDELELLMVGMPHLDFRELEAHTTYIGGDEKWGAQNPAVAAFWKVVHSLPLEDKQRLLLFATGSNKAPIGGLKNLDFKLQRMGPDTNSLPTSHTCFNTLLLPEYSSEEKLRERLTTAIRECEGFGLK